MHAGFLKTAALALLASIALTFIDMAPAAAAQEASPAPHASETPEASGGPLEAVERQPAEDAPERDLVADTVALDISTSGLYDLAAWCRSLGLPETGGLEELRSRLYAHYGVSAPAGAQGSQRSIIIRSAGKADYFTMEGVEERYVRFSGGVSLTLSEPERGWTHDISAREIVFNQGASLLSARGDVRYTLKKPDGEERFSGERLDIDLETWAGFFLEGRIIRSGGSESLQTKFVFAADAVKTGSQERAVFDKAVISSSEDPLPPYSIRAARVWLLGSGEWAMSQAVLSVGEVPLLYLPFFFYNGEELVFHPVLGERDREGPFFQTTLYLSGQKPKSKESISLLQLQASKSSGPQRIQGLYLVPDEKGARKASPNVFKVMLDAWANLGAFLGAEYHLASDPKLKLDVLAVAAITRNVYSVVNAGVSTYSPYVAANDWQSAWNESRFLGLRLPLRYGADLGASLNMSPLSASLTLPLFSDPYVEGEFKLRKEDMDWFAFLKAEKAQEGTAARRGSLEWKLEAAYSPNLGSLAPYISSFNLNYARTRLTWASKRAQNDGLTPAGPVDDADPSRDFFYPDLWSMLDLSGKLAGTLFTWPPKPAGAQKPKAKVPAASPQPLPRPPAPIEEPEPLATPKASSKSAIEPRPPSDLAKPNEGQAQSATKAVEDQATAAPSDDRGDYPLDLYRLDPVSAPPPAQSSTPQVQEPITLSLSYALDPLASMERRFLSQAWPIPEEIDWTSLHDKALLRVSGSMDAQAKLLGGAATLSARLNGRSQFQNHFNFLDDPVYLSQASLDSLAKADAQARSDNLSGSLKLNAKPFTGDKLWGESYVSWDLSAILYDYQFKAMDGDQAVYTVKSVTWEPTSITAHSLGAGLVCLPLGWRQSLSLSATLPPRDQAYNASLDAQAGPLKLGASSRLAYSRTLDDWVFDPLNLSATITPLPGLSIVDKFIYNIEQDRPESNAATLAYKGLSAAFTMKYSRPYYFDSASNPKQWKESAEDPTLRATDLSLSYAPSDWPELRAWKNRLWIKPSLSTNLSLNFQQFTRSSFSLTLGAQAGASQFLDLSFSAYSQNSAIFRYFLGLPGFSLGEDLDQAMRRDFFQDLLDSFTFFRWDESRGVLGYTEEYRRRSLFKLKTVSLNLVHHLDDWDLTLALSGKPVLKTVDGVKDYVFTPTFSLAVDWKPIPEIKTKTTMTGTGDDRTITIQ